MIFQTAINARLVLAQGLSYILALLEALASLPYLPTLAQDGEW